MRSYVLWGFHHFFSSQDPAGKKITRHKRSRYLHRDQEHAQRVYHYKGSTFQTDSFSSSKTSFFRGKLAFSGFRRSRCFGSMILSTKKTYAKLRSPAKGWTFSELHLKTPPNSRGLFGSKGRFQRFAISNQVPLFIWLLECDECDGI